MMSAKRSSAGVVARAVSMGAVLFGMGCGEDLASRPSEVEPPAKQEARALPQFDRSEVVYLTPEADTGPVGTGTDGGVPSAEAAPAQDREALACTLGTWNPVVYYPEDGRIGHGTGFFETSCTNGVCEPTWTAVVQNPQGHMWYGPYDTQFGIGWHDATFAMQIDNPWTGDDRVVDIDVVFAQGAGTFHRWSIRRDQMKNCAMGSGRKCYFGIRFQNPCFTNIETRVWYRGTAAIHVFWSMIGYDQMQPYPYAVAPQPL